MNILVTGATGFIGMEVAHQLVAAGHRPRLMVRRPTRGPLVAHLDAQLVHGDLRAPESLDRAVRGADAIIHLGGRATFESYDRLRPTLVDGVAALTEAAVRHGVGSIVFGSSAFVYAGDGSAITRSTEPAPVLDYGRAKVDAEAILAAVSGDIGVGVLRLPHVYGPQSLLFGLARRRIVPFPGDGENRFAQLHVADCARALIVAAETGWTGTAPIADHRSPTWNEFFEVLGRHAPRIRVLRFPERLATVGARVLAPVLGRLGATMVAPDTIRGWNLDIDVDDRSVWDELGIEPHFPSVADGVPATLDGVVAFRWVHPVNDWS